MAAASRPPLPPRPDLVLRLAFAGTRRLPEDAAVSSHLEAALRDVYGWIAERLTELAGGGDSGDRATGDAPRRVSRFYSSNRPLVRLISGLAEGADDLAVRAMAAAATLHPGVRFESAGALAFPHDAYRASRERSFQERFDELYRACSYIVELDGIHDRENDARRQRAYRAQTTVLLRQADLFIALTDTSGKGRPGGTREAVRAALAFGLPVVWIDTASGATRIIGADEDADDVLTQGRPAPPRDALSVQVGEWVSTVLADPDIPAKSLSPEDHAARREHAAQLLGEFFDRASTPPERRTFRQWLWTRLEDVFSKRTVSAMDALVERYGIRPRPDAEPPAEKELRLAQEAPYQIFRTRASNLTAYYAGLYRGAFLLNFGLAAVAVGFAALSLVTLAGGLSAVVRPLSLLVAAEGTSLDDAVGTATNSLVFLLGVVKLGILAVILLNTNAARKHRWNERAVDYRYLAERLRTMFYLPRAGGFQLVPVAPGYSARVVRQSAADWLFDAIVRHVSPRALAKAPASSGVPPVFRPDPSDAVRHVRDHWLFGQAKYHLENADRMSAMFTVMEYLGRGLNKIVIAAVCADLFVLLAGAFHVGPSIVHGATPWLVFLAALLPVTVAAINGIRFQSECQRLAERSRAMVEIIAGRWKQADELDAEVIQARSNPATDPGSWTPAALRLGESIAKDMMNEAAEWSVLYGKEIVET